MIDQHTEVAGLPSALVTGRICAAAGQAQREALEWSSGYPELFGAAPFDPALFGTVCLCTAFSAPWLGGADLRITNRAALWGFGVDWLIDYVAATREQVADVVDRCLAAVAGPPPADGDELVRSLVDIRADLASASAFTVLGEVWRDELRGFLSAMAREWEWNAARANGAAPTFEQYLENADNLGFSVAFVAHWISAGPSPEGLDVEAVMAAGRQAQRTMRLINDLGSYERDLKWGDLNGLMLGVTREEARRRVAEGGRRFRALTAALDPGRYQRLITYMERQVEFCEGFQDVTDYWGSL